MKLNKPKVSDNQTELESYVESLLKDNAELVNIIDCKVTPLRSNRLVSKETTLLLEPEVLNESEKSQLNQQLTDKKSLKQSSVSIERQQGESEVPAEKNVKTTQPIRNRLETKISGDLVANDNPDARAGYENVKQNDLKDSGIESTRQHQDRVAKEFQEYQQNVHTKPLEIDPRLKNVEKLLNRIALATTVAPTRDNSDITTIESKSKVQIATNSEVDDSSATSNEIAQSSFSYRDAKPLKEILGDVFQTLVFDVNSLPLAVPLVKLGGIVNFTEEDVTPLVGTPEWFLGLVPNERGNLMVVDTQKFLMPEKSPKESSEYQYLIVLDNSNWALACHAVNDAKNLSPDDIRWSARSSKRPWFAGMVVEYMSALIEVDELINLLVQNIVD